MGGHHFAGYLHEELKITTVEEFERPKERAWELSRRYVVVANKSVDRGTHPPDHGNVPSSEVLRVGVDASSFNGKPCHFLHA